MANFSTQQSSIFHHFDSVLEMKWVVELLPTLWMTHISSPPFQHSTPKPLTVILLAKVKAVESDASVSGSCVAPRTVNSCPGCPGFDMISNCMSYCDDLCISMFMEGQMNACNWHGRCTMPLVAVCVTVHWYLWAPKQERAGREVRRVVRRAERRVIAEVTICARRLACNSVRILTRPPVTALFWLFMINFHKCIGKEKMPSFALQHDSNPSWSGVL